MILKYRIYALLFVMALFSFACSTKNDFDAFKEADYTLESIDEVRVNGVNLLNKKQASDFSLGEAAALFSAVSDNSLLAKSTLALNVDLGDGNKDRTMTVTQLKWQLLVNNEQAASGVVEEPVELKNGLNTISVSSPVKLREANGRTDLNNLLRLATLLNSDKDKKPAITLQIKPTIQTAVGPFELPAFINLKQ